MKSKTYRERVYYVLPVVDTGHILVLILNNKFSLFVAKSPSVFVFFFWEGVNGVGVQGLWGMVLFGAFGVFLLGYSGCTFDNWLVDRLHKKKIEEKTYLCLSSKTIVITSANIVVIVVSKLFSAGVWSICMANWWKTLFCRSLYIFTLTDSWINSSIIHNTLVNQLRGEGYKVGTWLGYRMA